MGLGEENIVMDKPLTCDHYKRILAYIGVLMLTPLKKQIPCNGSWISKYLEMAAQTLSCFVKSFQNYRETENFEMNLRAII